MKGFSKRQLSIRYGLGGQLIETLIDYGFLVVFPESTPKRPKIDPISVDSLIEGEHYIQCLECGARVAMICQRHLDDCSLLSFTDYIEKYPGAPLMSGLCKRLKAKTEAQKHAQSQKLKARFQTPDGEETRKRISDTSKDPIRVQRVIKQLTELNRSSKRRAQISSQMKAQYATGWNPAKDWHHEHRDESLAGAANARRHINRKRTKPHLNFKEALLKADLRGFITEYEVGFHAIDEARPDLKLAIEVDGCYWHGCSKCGFPGRSDTLMHDKSKTTFLTHRGWLILRFHECDIKSNLQGCLEKVRKTVSTLEGAL